MNKKNRLAGRFLPSRVYARWKWTVRFGLGVIPLVLFLAGALTVYLTPGRYQSTVVFEYLGKRPPSEVEALLKSRGVCEIADDAVAMSNRLKTTKDTTYEILSHPLDTSVDAASGWIELKVTHSRKEIARDFASALPEALDSYESMLASQAIRTRMEALEVTMTGAEDEVESNRLTLARLLTVRGDPPADSAARLDVDAARLDWEDAHSRVLEMRARIAEARLQLSNPGKWVIVHSNPVISDQPAGQDSDESLGSVILESLGTGLAFALSVPYLLELTFPRRRKSRQEERALRYEDPEIAELPVKC